MYAAPGPPAGNYFGSHFIMGGERFDTPQPEAYLFGENADLNFLGSRPTVVRIFRNPDESPIDGRKALDMRTQPILIPSSVRISSFRTRRPKRLSPPGR